MTNFWKNYLEQREEQMMYLAKAEEHLAEIKRLVAELEALEA